MSASILPPSLAAADMEMSFHGLADALHRACASGERFTAWFEGETTDFVRMNRGKVRQPGSVTQRYLTVRLIRGSRHARHVLSLSGNQAADEREAVAALQGLRAVLADVADDPHLLLAENVQSTRHERGAALPAAESMVGEILDAAKGLDLVGLYAAGPVVRGFANWLGQRNWHAATTFNLQWSLYHRADKAVKSAYAGFEWDRGRFAEKMGEARERLALVARPARSLLPGSYRVYLEPSALEAIVGLLGWGAFSGRALATRQSPFVRMQDGERLHPSVTLVEDIARGVAPAFQEDGFARPGRVPLVDRGAFAGSLVSPRTAREFGLPANAANEQESPESLAMAAGTLRAASAAEALGEGLLIGNLWYLNFSDRPAGRITGMTRFATFWVEGGTVVAPVDVLRFDDSIYRMLGRNLEALTDAPELLLSADTYRARSLACVSVPGALIRELAFTL